MNVISSADCDIATAIELGTIKVRMCVSSKAPSISSWAICDGEGVIEVQATKGEAEERIEQVLEKFGIE